VKLGLYAQLDALEAMDDLRSGRCGHLGPKELEEVVLLATGSKAAAEAAFRARALQQLERT
jgi:hypothetical protein